MRHVLSTRDLRALFVGSQVAKVKWGIRPFMDVKLVPQILHVVVIFWLSVPCGTLARTEDDARTPFGLKCDVVQVDGEVHDLVFDLDLGPDDWVVSSHSTDSMFGKFSLRFQEPQAIELIGSMEEFPPSAWEVEPFSQLDIKVIREDTRLVQRIVIDEAHRGDVHGEVFFVLESMCTPFKTSVLLRKSTEDGRWLVATVGVSNRQ